MNLRSQHSGVLAVLLVPLIAIEAAATPITIVAPPGDPNVTVSGNAEFVGDSTVDGNLSVEASNGINDASGASITVSGNASFTDTSTAGIVLDSPNNSFGSLTFNSNGPVAITETNAMVLSGASFATNARLVAGDDITNQSGSVLDVDELSLSATGGVYLEGDHRIDALGPVDRGDALVLRNGAAALTIVGPVSDGSGEVSIATGGSLTVSGAISALDDAVMLSGNGVTLSATGDVDAGSGDVVIDGGVARVAIDGAQVLSTGAISITGDDIDLGPFAQVGGALGMSSAHVVTLAPATPGTAINLGDAAVATTPGLGLTGDELNRISTRTLRIGGDGSPGGSQSGTVTIGALVLGSSTVREHLVVESGAGIEIVGPVTVGGDADLSLLSSELIMLGADIDVGAGELLFGGSTEVLGQIGVTASMTSFLGDVTFGLGGADPFAYGSISTSGNVSFEAALRIVLGPGFDPMAGDVFDLVSASSIAFSSTNFLLPDLNAGLFWDFSVIEQQGRPDTLRLSVLTPPVSVPAPGTMALLLAGLAGIGFARRDSG